MSNGNSIQQALEQIETDLTEKTKRVQDLTSELKKEELTMEKLRKAAEALRPLSPGAAKTERTKQVAQKKQVPERPTPTPVPVRTQQALTMTEKVREALEAVPDRWMSAMDIREEMQKRHPVPSRHVFTTVVAPSQIKEPAWLRRKRMGKMVFFSLAPEFGGIAPSSGPGGA